MSGQQNSGYGMEQAPADPKRGEHPLVCYCTNLPADDDQFFYAISRRIINSVRMKCGYLRSATTNRSLSVQFHWVPALGWERILPFKRECSRWVSRILY